MRVPPPWRVEKTDGGYRVVDNAGQTICYVYAREPESTARIAKVLDFETARRVAVNIARLPELLEVTRK